MEVRLRGRVRWSVKAQDMLYTFKNINCGSDLSSLRVWVVDELGAFASSKANFPDRGSSVEYESRAL